MLQSTWCHLLNSGAVFVYPTNRVTTRTCVRENLQFAKTMDKNVGVKRADERGKDGLRVETGGKERFKNKLVMSRLHWASHVERMGDKKLQRYHMPRKWREKGAKED